MVHRLFRCRLGLRRRERIAGSLTTNESGCIMSRVWLELHRYMTITYKERPNFAHDRLRSNMCDQNTMVAYRHIQFCESTEFDNHVLSHFGTDTCSKLRDCTFQRMGIRERAFVPPYELLRNISVRKLDSLGAECGDGLLLTSNLANCLRPLPIKARV